MNGNCHIHDTRQETLSALDITYRVQSRGLVVRVSDY
jgi:hypothetical protein